MLRTSSSSLLRRSLSSNLTGTLPAATPLTTPIFGALKLSQAAPDVLRISLNRPEKSNALSMSAIDELSEAFSFVNDSPSIRAVLLNGEGKHFCAGIDLEDFGVLLHSVHDPSDIFGDASTRARSLVKVIRTLQNNISSPSRCRVPVICATHGESLGAGMALLSFTDIRIGTAGGGLQVTEPHLGFACDLGTLQRLPKLVSSASWTNEMCLSARRVSNEEAFEKGFFSSIFPTKEAAEAAALNVAVRIAKLEPSAVEETKKSLQHTYAGVSEATGLEFIALTNAAALQGRKIGKRSQK